MMILSVVTLLSNYKQRFKRSPTTTKGYKVAKMFVFVQKMEENQTIKKPCTTWSSFRNYVKHLSLFFDHPLTYGYLLAMILLISYLDEICDHHPPQFCNVICEQLLSLSIVPKKTDFFARLFNLLIHYIMKCK